MIYYSSALSTNLTYPLSSNDLLTVIITLVDLNE